MKNLNKIMTLVLIGLTLQSQNVTSQTNTIDQCTQTLDNNMDETSIKIHLAIENCIQEYKRNNSNLIKLLTDIKAKIIQILEEAPSTNNYEPLKKSIRALNPTSLMTMLGHVKIVLSNMHPKTKSLIIDNVDHPVAKIALK